MRELPLHYERPLAVQVLFAHLLPLIFGAVTGIALGASKPAYVVLSILAALGGLLAGLEHDGTADGASRGAAGGVLFGGGLLIAYRLAEKPAKVELPDPQVLLIVVTTVAGIVLGAAGGALRGVAERRAARPRAEQAPTVAAQPRPQERPAEEPKPEEPRPAATERQAPPAAYQHAALLARVVAAERAASEAQEQSRRLTEERHEVEGRVNSAEQRARDYEQHLGGLRDELHEVRAESERRQATVDQRAHAHEQELAHMRKGLEQARAEIEHERSTSAQRAQESRQEADRLREELEQARSEAERQRAAAEAQARVQPAAEELQAKVEAIAATAGELESCADSLERRAFEAEAAAAAASDERGQWSPREASAPETPAAPLEKARIRQRTVSSTAGRGRLAWSDPVLDALKRNEAEASEKVERLARELSRTAQSGADVSELQRELADAEERRDRMRARIEERTTALREHHRGGEGPPAGGLAG